MKTLWVNIAGTDASRKQHNLPKINYPLCFNLPPKSWSMTEGKIVLQPFSQIACLYLDIVFEYKENVEGNEYLLRFYIGASDAYFINQVMNPSVRDTGVTDYYSRWPEGYNLVSDVIPVLFDELLKKNVKVKSEGQSFDIQPAFDHSPTQIIQFLSNITSINEGDLISLGSFQIIPTVHEVPSSIQIKLDAGFEWNVEIIK